MTTKRQDIPKSTEITNSTIKAVPLAKIRVSINAQRELRTARVDELISNFSLEYFGLPVVNFRDGFYFNVDGQHRIEALKQWLGDDWEKQSVDCKVYSGLNEKQEAEMFDRLNNQLTVNTFDRFKVRVTAGRAVESAVKKVVEKQGLKISRDMSEGSVGAVGTLVKVFNRSDAATLGRALRMIRDSFGDPGFTASVIDGVAHVCQRYNGVLEDELAIEKLKTTRGGIGAVLSRAAVLRKQTAKPVPQCIAAATVDCINAKRGGTKLPSWWKSDEDHA